MHEYRWLDMIEQPGLFQVDAGTMLLALEGRNQQHVWQVWNTNVAQQIAYALTDAAREATDTDPSCRKQWSTTHQSGFCLATNGVVLLNGCTDNTGATHLIDPGAAARIAQHMRTALRISNYQPMGDNQ